MKFKKLLLIAISTIAMGAFAFANKAYANNEEVYMEAARFDPRLRACDKTFPLADCVRNLVEIQNPGLKRKLWSVH
ncbi:MAG: hypothetical protein LBT69_00505 [Lactobacillales bacterium]|jgi:hypothetical protein|nr:hypothetical protein [Lactobacillales bacterium]